MMMLIMSTPCECAVAISPTHQGRDRMSLCMYVCVYIYIYTCVYIYIYICVYTYIYIYVYLYIIMCIYICIYTYIHTYIHMYTCIYTHTYIHTHTFNIYIYIRIYLQQTTRRFSTSVPTVLKRLSRSVRSSQSMKTRPVTLWLDSSSILRSRAKHPHVALWWHTKNSKHRRSRTRSREQRLKAMMATVAAYCSALCYVMLSSYTIVQYDQ